MARVQSKLASAGASGNIGRLAGGRHASAPTRSPLSMAMRAPSNTMAQTGGHLAPDAERSEGVSVTLS